MRDTRILTKMLGTRRALAASSLALMLAIFAGQGTVPSLAAVANTPAATSGEVVTSYAEVVSRVAPAVVTIRAARRVRLPQGHPLLDDPTLRELFGNRFPQGNNRGGQQREPQTRRSAALGSGVVVTADGYILTNNHVVEEADQIKVELNDNRTFDAKVVGTDPPSDLAVLKIDASKLPVLPLADSDRVRVGDVVLAVGNPLGVGQTVTSGIISAKGRATPGGGDAYEDFLQTDAPINQGNSGGALVNTNGELVGINSQILSPSGGSIGIGFSIPSNMAKNVMEQLIKTGKVRRSRIGVGIQPITSDIAQSLGLQQVRGAIVTTVEPGSPAALAGVKRGDVITAFNNVPVNNTNELRNLVARTPPGTASTLTVLRDDREQQLRLTVSELTPTKVSAEDNNDGAAPTGRTAGGQLGLAVEPLTLELAARLKLRGANAQGVVVTDIDPDGPAADAGLQTGDVIAEANRQPLRSATDLAAVVSRAAARPVLLLVNREGQTIYVTVRPRQ